MRNWTKMRMIQMNWNWTKKLSLTMKIPMKKKMTKNCSRWNWMKMNSPMKN
jgi:hypothetical protein